MKLRGTYQPRWIQFENVVTHKGWRIKAYRIRRTKSAVVDEELFASKLSVVLGHLPQPAISDSSYGVGFYILHHGEHRIWFLLDWWYDQEILKHKLFSSPLDDPGNITAEDSDLMACTWEMAIQCFERQAWLETVLQNSDGPNLTAYLEKGLTAEL